MVTHKTPRDLVCFVKHPNADQFAVGPFPTLKDLTRYIEDERINWRDTRFSAGWMYKLTPSK